MKGGAWGHGVMFTMPVVAWNYKALVERLKLHFNIRGSLWSTSLTAYSILILGEQLEGSAPADVIKISAYP